MCVVVQFEVKEMKRRQEAAEAAERERAEREAAAAAEAARAEQEAQLRAAETVDAPQPHGEQRTRSIPTIGIQYSMYTNTRRKHSMYTKTRHNTLDVYHDSTYNTPCIPKFNIAHRDDRQVALSSKLCFWLNFKIESFMFDIQMSLI